MTALDHWAERSRKDRFIAKLVIFLNRAIYREVTAHHVAPPPQSGPQLSVSNHFGGLSDALVLLQVMARRPSIVARDVIWRIPVVGWLMTWIGGIPVHKPEDGGDGSNNDQMFRSCYGALADGGHMLIFPEGVTRNEPSIARVKTGAARIALGARSKGVTGLKITPAGIHYEDKAALRSRIVVIFDEAIDLDIEAETLTGDDEPLSADSREAVDALTARIDERLRRAAPDFEDWDEARALAKAAEIAIRPQLDDARQPVPVGLRDRLANVLADRPAEQRQLIREAVDTYQDDLEGVHLTDAGAHHRRSKGRLATDLVVQTMIGLLLLPFAIVGAAINLIPFLIVKAVGLLRVAPSVHSSIKPAVAFVAFGAMWAVVVWRAASAYGLLGAAAAVVLLPVYFAATVLLIDRVTLTWRMLGRWRARGRVGSIPQRLAESHDAVVRAVLEV
ncbi:MAG: 1-acyl-sn-glycerol-3-phosphate acyltransferase [Acidimicrobiales bacterium]